jgi:hypothetical protein
MKTLFILFFSIFLAPMTALSGWKDVKDTIFVRHDQKPEYAGKEAADVAEALVSAIEYQIKITYPCAQTINESDLSNLLEYERNKELLTSESPDLESIASASDANYVLYVRVSPSGSGQYSANASISKTNAKAEGAKSGASIKSGSAMRDSIQAAAKQFVDSMKDLAFAKGDCSPTNFWTGTITYKRSINDVKTNTEPTVVGDGKVTTTTKKILSHSVLVRIGLKGKPMGYFTLFEAWISNEKAERRINCQRNFGDQKPNWHNWGWDNTTVSRKQAVMQKAADASIAISKDRYQIRVSFPTIVGENEISETKHLDEGCGTAEDKRSNPIKLPYDATISVPLVDMPIQNPNQLQGSMKDSLGGTLSWSLTKRLVSR